jgi:hypothetical protein
MTGLRFLFRVTLRRLDLAAEIYHIKEPQKIPAGHEPGRDQAPVGSGKDGSRAVRTRLRLQLTREYRARRAVAAPLPAISCLGASRTPPVGARGRGVMQASEKLAQILSDAPQDASEVIE